MNNINTLIPIASSVIGNQTINAVDGRRLHAFLEVGKVFAAWMPEQIEAFGFVEHVDYETCFPNLESKKHGGSNRKEYLLSIPMAKELSMVQRTEKGKEARLYFLECEKRALQTVSTPPSRKELAMMVIQAEEDKERLEAEKQFLSCKLTVAEPKATAFDLMAGKDHNVGVREAGVLLNVGQSWVVAKVLELGWAYRSTSKSRRLKPYAEKVKDGVVASVQIVDSSGEIHEQFRITERGISVLALEVTKGD